MVSQGKKVHVAPGDSLASVTQLCETVQNDEGSGSTLGGTRRSSLPTARTASRRVSLFAKYQQPNPFDKEPEDEAESVPIGKYVAYRVHQWIAKRGNQVKLLVLVAFLEVFGGGILLALGPMLNGNGWNRTFRRIGGKGQYSVFWASWSFLVNPGNHIGYDGPWERLAGVVLTVVGVLYMSTVLGVVVDVIREHMEKLKLGTNVVEAGHTCIFGWTDRAPLIIHELILANESEGGGVVVILTEEPSKDIIEAQITHRFRGKFRGTRIIVRNGSSMLLQDLQKVAVHRAKVTILLSSPNGDADKADSTILRQVLTLRSLPALEGFIVAEVRDVDNEPLVKLVGGQNVETMVSHDVVGRMMVMSSRNPGLSRVYSEVLGFDGSEFYMANFPEIHGVTFGNLQRMFPDAIPIGIASPNEHCLWLKPSLGRVTKPGEKVIVIAEDDDTFSPKPMLEVLQSDIPKHAEKEAYKERILFCGWRRDIRDIILYLDRLVKPGSEIHMCTDSLPLHERDIHLQAEGLNLARLKNVTIEHFNLNTSVRRKVEELPLEEYTSVMIFPDQAHETDMMHSDSHAIATLLLIRDIQRSRLKDKLETLTTLNAATAGRITEGLEAWRKQVALGHKCPIICEILDPRTQETIEANLSVSGSSDFCQSNRLVAQILSMVSENRGVKRLLLELLSPDGTSFKVERAYNYVDKGELLNFFELADRIARSKDEILVGFQHFRNFETIINPLDKSEKRDWYAEDLVVLHGVSRLQGQDRTKANKVLDALNQQSDRRDRVTSLDADSAHRLKRAKTASVTASINTTIAKGLTQLRIQDLQWLQSKIQAELRTRDLTRVTPLVLPLDPSLEKVITNLNDTCGHEESTVLAEAPQQPDDGDVIDKDLPIVDL